MGAKCAYDCYNQESNYDMIHKCVERCQHPMHSVQKRMQSEFQGLQGSVQACQQSIQKRLEPRLHASTSPEEQKNIQAEYERAAVQCIKMLSHCFQVWKHELTHYL